MAHCFLFRLVTTFVFLHFRLSKTRPIDTWEMLDFNITGELSLLSAPEDYKLFTEYDEYEDYEYKEDTMADLMDSTSDNVLEGLPKPDLHPTSDRKNTASHNPEIEELFSEGDTLRLRSPPRKTPEYMLDIYDTFSKEKFTHPSANIVRSYMNINDEDVEIVGFDLGKSQEKNNLPRIHKLVFNITSTTREEDIVLAELRLYTLVVRDRNIYMGVDRKVSVFEVIGRNVANSEKYMLISDKHVYGHDDGWEVFDVTPAVKRWVNNWSCVQVLEVRIESVFSGVIDGDMDIDVNPTHQKDPLLVVFSNNKHYQHVREEEVQELINHEIKVTENESKSTDYIAKHLSNIQLSNFTSALSRVKRSRRRNSCKRRPMIVDFKKINLDGVIVFPSQYMAFECIGRCYLPIGDHLSPTKHAIIQTKMHAYSPKSHSRACCVPTKLDPISVLYYDDNGVLTYQYKYEGMVVGQCGCR